MLGKPPTAVKSTLFAPGVTHASKAKTVNEAGACPDLQPAWQCVRERAVLHAVRIHYLLHSFASQTLALGEGLPIIGRLLGHRRLETTARYAHLARDAVREFAERIGVNIAADIL